MSLFCFRDSRSLPTPYCLQKSLRSDPFISFWPLTTSIGSLCSSTMPRCLCTFHPTWHTLPRSSEDWFLLVYPVSKVSITSTGMPARTTQSKVPFSCHTDRICLFESTYHYQHYEINLCDDLLSVSHNTCRLHESRTLSVLFVPVSLWTVFSDTQKMVYNCHLQELIREWVDAHVYHTVCLLGRETIFHYFQLLRDPIKKNNSSHWAEWQSH